MSAFTKPELATIRHELDQAFAVIAKKHNLEVLKIGNIRYDAHGGFVSKLEAMKAGGESKEAQRYEMLCLRRNDLPPIGTVLNWNPGQRMKIIGANTTLTKIVGEDVPSGVRWTLPVESVMIRWAQQKAVQS